MFDDDEYEEEEQRVVNVFYEEEDPFDEEEEDTSEADALSKAYTAKGFSDRALVDEQAKEADEKKKKKRDHLTQLKQTILTLKSGIGKKEREMHALELEIQKDERSETRERVLQGRQEFSLDESELDDVKAQNEIKDIETQSDRRRRDREKESLKNEILELKDSLAKTVREASALEQEIFRT